MTTELYNKLQPYKAMMQTMICNSSYSNVPLEYQELVLGTMKSRGVSLCHCNSGVLNATSRLYQEMLVYEHGNVKAVKGRRGGRLDKK